jgi:Protein of unknown function DUF72
LAGQPLEGLFSLWPLLTWFYESRFALFHQGLSLPATLRVGRFDLQMSFDREKVRQKVAQLANAGVFIGTSSWKYEGWRGMLYDESRYIFRGKVAESRFKKNCLSEYAEVFKTVCVDDAYYKFPDEKYLGGLVGQVPADFQFGFKVTDEITVKKFPNLPRFGARAGERNEHFLDAGLFERAFLKPCEPFRRNIVSG